ncbi:MAG: slipin family protein [Patescibacteria group bacterium]
MDIIFSPLIFIIVFLVLISIRQVNQYQRGVKFRFGRYVNIKGPGWRLVFPVIEQMQKVDIRVKAESVPDQEAITKDNISAKISAVIYYKITDVSKAIIEVENYQYAVSQLAQTTMRNVIGEMDLDQLLSQREKASTRIREIVGSMTLAWGVHIENVELKDITLPEEMKRTMAKQAEAERERRAVVINSLGEVEAAENLAKAAHTLSASNGALHLRTLNTINDVSSDASNTIIFAVPLEVLRAFDRIGGNKS